MNKKDWLLVAWLILNMVDFIMTAYALPRGATELNPFYYMNPLLMDIIKIAIIPIFLVATHRWIKIQVYYVIVGFYAILFVSNTIMLIRL